MKKVWMLAGLLVFAIGCDDSKVSKKPVRTGPGPASVTASSVTDGEGADPVAGDLASAENEGSEAATFTSGDSADAKESVEGEPAVAADTEKLDAKVVLKDALANAKEHDKKLFVHFGAPW